MHQCIWNEPWLLILVHAPGCHLPVCSRQSRYDTQQTRQTKRLPVATLPRAPAQKWPPGAQFPTLQLHSTMIAPTVVARKIHQASAIRWKARFQKVSSLREVCLDSSSISVARIQFFHSRGCLQSAWNNNAFSSTTAAGAERPPPTADPSAKRPNKVCDPYGQGGQPMSKSEAERLKSTIHADWRLKERGIDETTNHAELAPIAIHREFYHPDFLTGARFVQRIAAVAQINAHFPSIQLDRRIFRKNWQVVTTVRCHTLTLGGLSSHDFFLAMVS